MGAPLKRNISNLIFVILNLTMTVLACVFLGDMEKIVKVIAVLAFLLLAITIPSVTNNAAHKVLLAISVIFALILISFIILYKTGWLYALKDFETIKGFILSTKQWGVLVFLAITLLQVVVLPIPSAVTILIGVAIYGPFWSFVLSTIGTFIGSIICFALGRTFGKKMVSWMFGIEKTEKYADFLNRRGKGMFIIMLLFPFFPDDLLCTAAGISTMSKKFFVVAMILTRPIMIAFTAFLGSGKIIPFNGWGIPVWISLFVATAAAFIIISKVKDKLMSKKKDPGDSAPSPKSDKKQTKI